LTRLSKVALASFVEIADDLAALQAGLNEAKVTMRKSYGFPTCRVRELALDQRSGEISLTSIWRSSTA
jgi:hypothetical protein